MPWKPGECGNPKGRPPLPSTETLTGVLKSRVDKQEIADRLIALAREGNVAALKYIYDRIEGMPHQSMKVSGGDQPVGLIFVNPGETTETTPTPSSS